MVRFTKKEVNSYTLGEQLKKIRSEGRVTLSEVSRDTKIPVKYLEMIEEGNYQALPPDVYVKGFLKKYGDYFGLDVERMTKLYEKEKEISRNLGEYSDEKKKEIKFEKVPRRVITPKIFAAVFAIIAILGGVTYLYRAIGKFASVPRLVITSPKHEQVIEGETVEASGFTDKDAKLEINDQPVLIGDSGEFKINIALREGINSINVKATNRFNKDADETVNVNVAEKENPENVAENEEGQNEGSQVSGEQDEKKLPENVKMTVRVSDKPTWIQISADGNKVYSATMQPDEPKEFEANDEIRVTSGKGNMTFISVNGNQERMLQDDPGMVKDVAFTKAD